MMHVSQQLGHCHLPKPIAFLCAESLSLEEKVSKDELTFTSYLCSSALRLALLSRSVSTGYVLILSQRLKPFPAVGGGKIAHHLT
jgi:hypothetical protein